MARTDEQELSVRVEAKIADFERNLKRASKISDQNFGKIRRDGVKAATDLEGSFARAGKNIGSSLKAGLVAGLSAAALTGVVKSLADVAKGVASIGDEAKRAGVSAKAFQELSFVARQNRIEVDALTDGLKELALRTDEVIQTGGGAALESFNRLGMSATSLRDKLKDPSALFTEIIGKMEKMDTASQIRIADELFGGTAGEQFVKLLDRGAEGIRTLVTEANDLGLVLDDKMIAKADEIDRRFGKIVDTVGISLKRAVIDVVDSMSGFFDQFAKLEAQQSRTIELSLSGVYADRKEALATLADLEGQKSASSTPALYDQQITAAKAELEELTQEAMRLRDVLDRRAGFSDTFVYTGDAAADAKPKVSTLADAASGLNGAGLAGAKGINSFADAVRALKGEIPGLAGQLADMDAKMRIEGAYRAALKNARSIGDTLIADQLKADALNALSVTTATGDSKAYLKPKLAAGQGAGHIDNMQGDFADALSTMLASAPESIRAAITINSGFRTIQRQAELFNAAVKKYGSVAAARKWVAPPGKSQHNKGNAADLGWGNDEAMKWAHQNAERFGLTFPMSNEDWHIESAGARRQQNDDAAMENYNASEAAGAKKVQDAADQASTYAEIIAGSKQFQTEQTAEAAALGMTSQKAAALRYEQQMLNEAMRAGIDLSPAQRSEIQQAAAGMAQLEAATASAATSQEDLKSAQTFLAQGVSGFFSSVITGSASVEEALGRLLSSLAEAALEAAFLGSGPLGGMFGGGAGIIGSLFGLKDGGAVPGCATGGQVRGPGGPREDKVLARLSAGEFVVNAKATAKNRALLEAVNSNRRIPAFANGGMIGRTPIAIPASIGAGARSGSPIAINSTVTVNAKGGDTKANDDLAKQVSRQVDAQIRATVQQELRSASRPGGR